MSYVSLLKNIPDILSQPAGIAAIASVGIHGAIAFILPLMPVDSSKSTTQVSSNKPVGLVQLSQADQNRLPQIPGTSQVALKPQVPLPNFATQPTQLAPLPPTLSSSSQVILPPIPKTANNYPIASVPKGQSLRIIPQTKANFQIDTSGFNASKRTAQSFPRFDNNDIKIASSSQPLSVGRLPQVQADNKIPEGIPNTPPVVSSSDVPTTLPSTPIPSGQPIETSSTPQTMPVENDVPNTATPNQDLITPVGETPKAGDNLTLAAANLPQWQQSSVSLPELPLTTQKDYTVSAATRELTNKTTTLAEQFVKVKQQYPNIETKQPISLAIDKAGLDRRVEVGLVVNPDGKNVESLEFLDNSVSSESRTAIREYLRDYFQKNPAQANGKPKYYTFSVSPNLSPKNDAGNSSQTTPLLPASPVNQTSSKVPQATEKPLSGLRITSKQPLTIPQAPEKPLPELPVGGKQSLLLPQVNKPQSSAQVRKNQTLPVLEPNRQQLSEVQASVQPSPIAQVNKQQLLGARIRNSQPLPTSTPEATAKPSFAPEISSNQTSPTAKPSQKLLQQLRELREQRETSNQEK
ncbi:hypothetical protein PI95_027250 [Hassallia byssoidea VB512170]|uniref:Uncharacterized protein n=1 Tax=Hassallia byssoidea VB512170 TaxID=1304833 RepID=A0A846HG81_9CYAN|nr:hypothetical protein [Hassalia byssoidea]NEU76123.1 hypothetical protein [Hassalia byssoidea VB512170]